MSARQFISSIEKQSIEVKSLVNSIDLIRWLETLNLILLNCFELLRLFLLQSPKAEARGFEFFKTVYLRKGRTLQNLSNSKISDHLNKMIRKMNEFNKLNFLTSVGLVNARFDYVSLKFERSTKIRLWCY